MVTLRGDVSSRARGWYSRQSWSAEQHSITIERDGTGVTPSRELLRTRANPLTHDQARRMRVALPAGPTPRSSFERSPHSGRRRTPGSSWSPCGNSTLAAHTRTQSLPSMLPSTPITVDHDDGPQRTFRPTTALPVCSWKAEHPAHPMSPNQPTMGAETITVVTTIR